MGAPKKIEEVKMDPALLLSLAEGNATSEESKSKKLHKAALLGKFEKVIDTLTEYTGSNATKSTDEENNTSDSAEAPASEGSSDVPCGARNFYMSNGIPVELLLEMLKNNMEQTNASYELTKNTALAMGGLSKDSTTGEVTITGKALASSIADNQVTAGEQKALQTNMQGVQGFAEGLMAIGAEGLSHVGTGHTNEEDANVSKIENALEMEKSLPEVHLIASNSTIIDQDSPKMKRAIHMLRTGGFDATKEDANGNAFGSIKVQGKIPTYELDNTNARHDFEIDTGLGKVKVAHAMQAARTEDREAIRENLEDQLKIAKKTRRKKKATIEQNTTSRSQFINQLGRSVSGGVSIGSSMYVKSEAQAQAQQTVAQSINTTTQSVKKGMDDAIDSGKKGKNDIFDLLKQMYSRVGSRG